jgi:ATP-dependent DNA helicase RecG
MSHAEIMQRLWTTSGLSWDAGAEPGSSLSDLDMTSVQHFVEQVKKIGRRPVPAGTGEVEFLERLNLLESGVPTRAALLPFGKDPLKHFPAAYVKLGRFRSPTLIVDDKRVDGTLLSQVDECMTWFRERFQTEFVITGAPQREVIWEYPLEAVREAMINALCHRDYRSNTNVQIRLYDDHLEIWNPGDLPTNLTTDDLLREHDSVPPNRLLADCLFFCGLIENWGSGTIRMAEALTAADLPLPEFDNSTHGKFRVVLRSDRLTEESLQKLALSEKQIKAVMWLKTEGQILTNERYQETFAVSKRTASNDLRGLVDQGVLEKHGKTGKGTYYTLIRGKGATKGQQRGNAQNLRWSTLLGSRVHKGAKRATKGPAVSSLWWTVSCTKPRSC